MRPRTQKQPQVKKELCQVLDDVDVDVNSFVSKVGGKARHHGIWFVLASQVKAI